MHMSKVSIRDVAALAGVSTATVSHVINNTRYVKEETKRLVLRYFSEQAVSFLLLHNEYY